MKPLHIGLLIVGAALAGGLAMKMTELQPAPVASSPAIRVVPVSKTVPASEPVVQPVPPKPSPMPRRIAPAPAPVYVEPVHVDTIQVDTVHVAPVAPKTKPLLIARVGPPRPMLPPVPYEPASPPLEPQAAPIPEPPPPAPRRTATLPPGTAIAVRLSESVSSERGIAGDTFDASLLEPLVVDGLVIAERGARAHGLILGTQRAGRVSGTSSLDLELTMVETADGQKVEISTVPWSGRGDASYGADAAKIGGGAGGGKGAAIGAGAGGVPGAGAAAVSRGKPVNVPAETVIRFRLASLVTITERPL